MKAAMSLVKAEASNPNAGCGRKSIGRANRVLPDMRFMSLLGKRNWNRLPDAVRARFSKRLAPDQTVTYTGKILDCRRSFLGGVLVQLCRLIGSPLPLTTDIGVPAAVAVTEDGRAGGQFWTRMYGRRNGFPQVIHSSKRFAGKTGLEEYLGLGFGIALTLSADERALHFHSDHYYLAIGGARLRLPRWLGPGDLTISHIDQGEEFFLFTLSLIHPLFGELLNQTGQFRERVITAKKEGSDE